MIRPYTIEGRIEHVEIDGKDVAAWSAGNSNRRFEKERNV